MRKELIATDVTVIGGGLAGVCAAIAAARLGKKVALVNNRPVLGGNSSSEVRVWVCGATKHGVNRYARETGIMGELFVENQYRNPEGNPYIWDIVILEAVRAEANIQLFLNTDVHQVHASGDEENREISSVIGWMMNSERELTFQSPVYLDCTGDGLVGFLAGAKYRLGREAKHEFNESWAPEVADDVTLGSTILFYTKDVGKPVQYIAPSFAKNIEETSIPIRRVIRSGDSGCHYWWIEWGGEHDTVYDNELIRDELWSVIYGIWDYIKNSGKFDAETMTLEWVGSIPGKREYRRFVGEYVLSQNDILAQEKFEDRIGFGGWSIDLHPPQGMYAEESGSKHISADGIYHIPYRSLYSSNVSNLLFAGRNVSASHVAFGTTRVMATCAVMGEAAGTAAALCVQESVTPSQLHSSHLSRLQQTLLRQDASLIGIAGYDILDLSHKAQISASSYLTEIAFESSQQTYELHNDIGFIVPVAKRLNKIELLLDVKHNTDCYLELWSTGKGENYVPAELMMTLSVTVKQGEQQWVGFSINLEVEQEQNLFIIVKENPSLQLHHATMPIAGVLSFERLNSPDIIRELEDADYTQPVLEWSMKNVNRKQFCFKADADDVYAPSRVLNGYKRPYAGPQLWVSDKMSVDSTPYIELYWQEQQVEIRTIELTWNDDVNEDLINLHHHETPFRIIPELVADYRLEAMIDTKEWQTIYEGTNNHKRRNVIGLDHIVKTNGIRLVITATNGSEYAQLIEMRVYE
ncbi:MAG TPA: FAD-dependent oxidoreductase [Candidatus Paenibacillus intestinavium]|nr:FAD-dependent oxidoreductase [Candidatus Paenibacillus intestinavium]